MATAVPSTSVPGIVGVSTMKLSSGRPAITGLRAVNLGEPSGPWTMGAGVTKNTTEGSPGTPCLEIPGYGLWSFRWTVAAGDRTLAVLVKQAVNTSPYPSVVLKKNAEVGLNSDATFTSAGGAGWVTITASFTASDAGAIWVELWNYQSVAGDLDMTPTPAYFDHLVVT